MGKSEQIKSGAIITYISNACNIIISIAITPIILGLIGKEEYGLYSLIYSIMGYFSILDFGFGNAMIRYVAKYKAEGKDEKNINSLFLLIYCVIGIITLLVGSVIYANLGNIFGASLTEVELEKAGIMMLIFLIGTAISFPLSVFSSYILANEKFVFLKILNLARILLYPIMIIPLLIFGYKSISMVVVYTVLNLAMHFSYTIYAVFKLKMKLTFDIKKIDFSIFKEIIVYSFFIFLAIIVDTIFNNTDQVILGIVSGTAAVSVYSVANQIKNANMAFSTAISTLFLPKITKLLSLGKNDEINKTFLSVSKIQLYIMLLILSGFFIFGKSFVLLWVGNEYLDAYYIVLWLIGISIIPLTQNLGISVLQAMNKHKFRSVVYIIIAVFNVIISIPLAKAYAGIGAAIGSAIAVLLGQVIIMNIYYYRVAKLDIPMYWKNFIKVCLPVLIFSLISAYLIRNLQFDWFKLFVAFGVYTFIYIIYIFAFHFTNDERLYFKNKLVKRNEK